MKSLLSLRTWHGIRTHLLTQYDWNSTRKSRRSTYEGMPIPWWTYSAVEFIDQVIPSSSLILEFGGGNSTLFWANRGNPSLTLEADSRWHTLISASISKSSQKNQVVHVDLGNPKAICDVIGSRTFDLAVIDGGDNRSLIADIAKRFLGETGMILWDNSERLEYQSTIKLLHATGWNSLDFFGISPINAYASKTSLFFRDSRHLLP